MTARTSPSIAPDLPSPSPGAARERTPRPDIRDDLRKYADLGGFTLTPQAHAWYAGADTVGSSEDARAASTVLAELRGRDLPAVRAGAARLAVDTALREPGTPREARSAVALLLRVRDTLTTLSPAAYEAADLDHLVAATADGSWRKEQGVQLSWLRRRSLLARARRLAASRRTRRDALHSALAEAASERTEWAALAPDADSLRPALPQDSAFLDETAQALEATEAGLRELGRLLRPEQPLETTPFDDLAELLDRLAADEGTLYRLPTLRSLRDRLLAQGLSDLLADLTTRQANGPEAVAAYDARQAEGEPEPRESEAAAEAVEPEPVEAEAVEAEPAPTAATATEEPAESGAAEATAAEPAEPADAAEAAEAEHSEAAEAAAAPDPAEAAEAEPAAPAEAVEAAEAGEPEATADTQAVEAPDAEAPDTTAEAHPETRPQPTPATTTAEPAAVETAEPAEPQTKAEPEATAPQPQPAQANEPAEPAEATEPAAAVEAAEAAEPQTNTGTEPTEPQPQPEPAEPDEPAAPAEATAAAEPAETTDPTDDTEPAEAGEPSSAASAGQRVRRPRKPAISPGRPVTAYSARELVAVVRWIDGDGVERTNDELLRAAMKELGFARLGPRIKEALGAAVTEVRG